MSIFFYDILTLIELVESRPYIWDKTLNEYKDKILKKKLWTEVYKYLEKNFDDKTPKELEKLVIFIFALLLKIFFILLNN